VPVVVRFRGPAGQRVDLAGDFPDWKQPVPMPEETPGHYRCALELEPGLYRYKFLLRGKTYLPDPDAAVVDHAEGHDNAVLVVGGACPPLHFAPDRRHVAVYPDGRVVVHAELDDGAPVPSHVWVQGPGVEGGVDPALGVVLRDRCPGPLLGTAALPVHVVGRRGGRTQVTASGVVPGVQSPGERPWLGFLGRGQEVFGLPAPRSVRGAPPAWLDGAVFYGVFLDRWRRGGTSPPDERVAPRDAPSGPRTFYGGDLPGVSESLEELRDLGVDAVVLTPVHRSQTPHRYDGLDLQVVDPRLGGEGALRNLIDKAHGLGLRVVVDLAVTHVCEDHPAFRDLLVKQECSAYAAWFRVKRFPVRRRDPWCVSVFYDRFELPLLNLEPGPAMEHAVEAALKLVRLGVDGLRLDAVNDAPPSFWAALRRRTREVNPDLLLLGEVVSDAHARLAEERGLDTATDFNHREWLTRYVAKGEVDAGAFWNAVTFARHRLGPLDPCARLLFLDNHDTARFLSMAGSLARQHLALCYLYFQPEPLWLNYGTEADLTAGVDLGLRLDDAWPERLPMPGRDVEPGVSPGGLTTRGLMSQLAGARRALRGAGPVRCLLAEGPVLVLERPEGEGAVRLVLHAGTHGDVVVPAPEAADVMVSSDPRGDGFPGVARPLTARWERVRRVR
jgi:glycosidase